MNPQDPDRISRYESVVCDVFEGANVDRQLVGMQGDIIDSHANAAFLRKTFIDIGIHEVQRTHANTNLGYIRITRNVGVLTSRLFEIGGGTLESRDFNRWLGYIAKGGILLDGAIDLHEDYSIGLTNLAPTVFNRTAIFTHALPDLFRAAKMTPRLSVSAGIKAIAACIDDRARTEQLT